nr:precorrin-3B synthase [uncultured Acidocella sp.]
MSGTVKGWCPGAHRPMQAADGLILRIRPPLGRLSAAQAQGLAALARAEGQSHLALTSRANLQWRGVKSQRYEIIMAGLEALGLLDADAAQEQARNILLTPFWRDGDGTLEWAEELTAALPNFPALPGKFGFVLDTGPAPVLTAISADIRLERDEAGGLLVRADGAALGEAVTAQTAIPAMRRLADWFLAQGGAPGGRGRMRGLLRSGALPPGLNAAPAATTGQIPPLASFAFGELPVESLAALAGLGPELRLTPWRALYLPGLTALPALPGLIGADDPLQLIFACTGAPGCAEGFAPTRALAAALAAHLPPGKTLHVSGCGKLCAHPGKCDFTLIAAPDGFHLNDGPGLDPAALLSHPRRVFGTP